RQEKLCERKPKTRSRSPLNVMDVTSIPTQLHFKTKIKKEKKFYQDIYLVPCHSAYTLNSIFDEGQ
ncbi:MAG: hypothetical protein ACM3JQ_00415, partial [Candidatus Eiseniibacteriota bacterium]